MSVEQTKLDHDQLFKKLLDLFFLEFIALFLPQLLAYIEPGSLRPVDKEVFSKLLQEIGARNIADVLVEAKFKGEDSSFLIHVENQSSAQTDFGERMFWYWTRLMDRYQRKVYPIVIFSHDTPLTKEPNVYSISFPDKVINRFEYTVIQLNQLKWHDYLNTPNPVASALMSKMQVAPHERVQVKLECIKMLLSLGLNRSKTGFVATFVDNYLELNATEEQRFEAGLNQLLPTPERNKFMEIMNSWQRRALEQGRRAGEADLVIELLAYRFGSVAEPVLAQVEKLAEPKLKELAKALFGFAGPADLTGWLAENLQP